MNARHTNGVLGVIRGSYFIHGDESPKILHFSDNLIPIPASLAVFKSFVIPVVDGQ